MTWTNGPLTLYHGCDDKSARGIIDPTNPAKHRINLKLCKRRTDFGQGFYTTTNLHQAKNWANLRVKRLKASTPSPPIATVLSFTVDRNNLAGVNMLCFVTEGRIPGSSDYWDMINACRKGVYNHQLKSPHAVQYYDVVFGVVSLWPQTLVIKDCDQISFHNPHNLSLLTNPTALAKGTPTFP
jgi:hypothetical protein